MRYTYVVCVYLDIRARPQAGGGAAACWPLHTTSFAQTVFEEPAMSYKSIKLQTRKASIPWNWIQSAYASMSSSEMRKEST